MSLDDRARRAASQEAATSYEAQRAAVYESAHAALEPQVDNKAAEWFERMGIDPVPIEHMGFQDDYHFEEHIVEFWSSWEAEGYTFQLHAKYSMHWSHGEQTKIETWHVSVYGLDASGNPPRCNVGMPLCRDLVEFGRLLSE